MPAASPISCFEKGHHERADHPSHHHHPDGHHGGRASRRRPHRRESARIGSVADTSSFTTYSQLRFGSHRNGTQDILGGLLDEIRYQQGALSSNWIAAEYANQNNPGAFYAVGAQTAA